jgi:tripartite-type tricarboxylate transporter receptor subunit TctC
MQWTRRGFSAALAFAALVLSSAAPAQDYPSRAITLLLPFGAGGPSEAIIRRLAADFEQTWGKPVVVEARPGAGGLIGAEALVKAPPDGHTLMWGFASLAAYKVLVKDLHFDPMRDIAPVSMLVNVPGGLVTNGQVPVKNVDEFIAWVKANPGKYNYASAGRTTQYMIMEAFKSATGANLSEISFTAQAQILQALLRNDVQLAQMPLDRAMRAQVEAGKLKALVMVGERRAPVFPEIPTTAEKGWNIPNNGWQALFAPAATPAPIIDKLAAEVARYTASAETRKVAEESGMDLQSSTPAQLRQMMERDSRLWASIAASVGLQPQ